MIRDRITDNGTLFPALRQGIPGPPGEGSPAALIVDNQAARLALSAEDAAGVIVVQDNDSGAYLLSEGGDPYVLGDWIEIVAPGSGGGGGDDPRIVDAITSISIVAEQLVIVSGGVTYRLNAIPD
jgi:hypothetical protein